MKHFISDFRASIFSTEFLTRFRTKSKGSTVWYIFLLSLFCAAALVLSVLIKTIPSLIELSGREDIVGTYYPTNLQIDITEGIVTTNVEEPYFIDIPNDSDKDGVEIFSHFLVIDTKAENPYQAVQDYDSMFLLSKNAIAAQKTEGTEIRVFNLKDVDELHVTEQSARDLVKTLIPLLWALIAVCAVIAPFFIASISLLYYLVILFVLAFITLFFASFRKLKLRYREAYILSAYAITIPVLVDLVTDIIGMPDPGFLWILLFIVCILGNLYRSSVPTAEVPTS